MTNTEHPARRPTVERDDSGTYRADSPVPPSELVVEAVAAAEDADITELPPLGTVLDPDALDALFVDRFDGTPRDGGRVVFTYAGHEVTVTSDDGVGVALAPGDDA